MPNLTSRLIVQLIDGVTGPAKRAAASLRGLTTAARAQTLAAVKNINNVTGSMTAGLGAVGLYKAHEAVMKFATASNKLAAANPDFGADKIKEVQRLAREVSRASLFNPGQMMDAANTLARADVNLDAIKGTLKPLATAAMAADVQIGELADSFVKLASNFGMSLRTEQDAAKTFKYLGDLSVYVGQRAPGTFTDFVQAMKQVGAAARTAGIDIKWLAGAYIMLDKAGIRNEEAGTALRSLVKHLVQPTAASRKMYAQLGIDPSTFLKGGKQVTSEQFVAAFQSEYGKNLQKAAPKIQEIIDANLTKSEKGARLSKLVEQLWGGGMKAVDSRKVKKTIDDFLYSATETIDPQAWLDVLTKKGVTLGQFLRLVEPRQASRLINLLKEQDGEEGAQKKLNEPLSALPGFRGGLADEAGAKMMQGYPAAVKKLNDAFQAFIETLDKAGAIDALASAMTAVGNAIVAISQGTAGFKDWVIGLGAAVPVVGALAPLLVSLGTVLGTVGAALLTIVGTPAGIAIALGGITAAVIAWWPQIKEFFSNLDLFDAGAKIASSLWEGIKWAFGKVGDAAKFIAEKLGLGGGEGKPGEKSGSSLIIPPKSGATMGWGGPSIDDQAGSARGAGARTGEAYKDAVGNALQNVDKMIDEAVRRWVGKLSFTASPKITPQFGPAPAGMAPAETRRSAAYFGAHNDYGHTVAR